MLILTGNDLRFADIQRAIDDPQLQIKISDDAMERIRISRRVIEKAIERDETIYGVNTGFGKLSRVRIPLDKLVELQRNLIFSHATAVGEPLDPEISKLVLLLRVNALAKGYSGVRPELIHALVAMFNKGVIPVIPRQGSVGASGDLGPLSHMTLVVMGLGEAFYNGHRMTGATAMKNAKIKPVKLQPKEGLALINGTQIMTAVSAATLLGAENLIRHADIAAAMSIEALKGTNAAFDTRIQEVRPFPHQAISAQNLRKLLAESWILASHVDCGKVQDPYSLRCVPQVHGASRTALSHVKDVLRIEFNSANDNPLIFPDEGDILSGGNFHGQPIALASDYMAMAVSELASISERRVENLVNPELSGLPAFLAPTEGLHSGYMMAQVTAASLVSENKALGHPASIDSIPTSGNKEDHVSMGTIAALKAAQILKNTETVLAIEFLCAAQGLEYRGELKPGKGVTAAHSTLRRSIPPLKEDRLLYKDVDKARKLIVTKRILRAVERKVGQID
jgi:histidine ammonia-lyase